MRSASPIVSVDVTVFGAGEESGEGVARFGGSGEGRREGIEVEVPSRSGKESERVPKMCWWDGGM